MRLFIGPAPAWFAFERVLSLLPLHSPNTNAGWIQTKKIVIPTLFVSQFCLPLFLCVPYTLCVCCCCISVVNAAFEINSRPNKSWTVLVFKLIERKNVEKLCLTQSGLPN